MDGSPGAPSRSLAPLLSSARRPLRVARPAARLIEPSHPVDTDLEMATATDVRPIARPRDAWPGQVVLSLLGPLGFVAVQWRLNVRYWHAAHASAFAHGYVSAAWAEIRWISANVAPDLLVYAGLAGGCLILVALGYRVLWALPAILFAIIPMAGAGHAPQFIGTGWYALLDTAYRSSFGISVAASCADLVMVLVPGAVWLGAVPRRARQRLGSTDILALAVVIVVIAIIVRTSLVVDNSVPGLGMLWSVCVFALLASTSRPWWPWAPLLMACLINGLVGNLWFLIGMSGGRTILAIQTALGEQLAIALCALLASCWEPLSRAMRRSEESSMSLLVAVNVLNVADALFTQFAINARQATELNPLVRSVGLPAKIAGVGLLSWLLYRKRPALLLIPAAALLVVLAYHLSGLVIDT